MTENQLLTQCNYYSKKLGHFATIIACKKETLQEMLEEFKRLDEILIVEEKKPQQNINSGDYILISPVLVNCQ